MLQYTTLEQLTYERSKPEIMNILKRIGLMTGIFLVGTIVCFSQEWTSIVPLVSTCDDVKKAFGISECKVPVTRIEKPKYRITILFTSVDCQCSDKKGSPEWKVPKGTVEFVSVGLYEGIKLSDFKSDLKNFVRKPVYDLPGDWMYIDMESGQRLTVHSDEFIQDIYIFPTKRNALRLRCPSVRPFSL